MTELKTECRILGAEYKQEISNLRRQAYQKSAVPTLASLKYHWSAMDEAACILGVLDQGKLVSTVRLQVAYSRPFVEWQLQCRWPSMKKTDFPVAILSRAATSPAYAKAGLNALLNHWAFQIAASWGLPFLISSFIDTEARRKWAGQIGYKLIENNSGWSETGVAIQKKAAAAVLNLKEHLPQAVEVSKKIAGPSYHQFPWNGPFPAMIKEEKNLTALTLLKETPLETAKIKMI